MNTPEQELATRLTDAARAVTEALSPDEGLDNFVALIGVWVGALARSIICDGLCTPRRTVAAPSSQSVSQRADAVDQREEAAGSHALARGVGCAVSSDLCACRHHLGGDAQRGIDSEPRCGDRLRAHDEGVGSERTQSPPRSVPVIREASGAGGGRAGTNPAAPMRAGAGGRAFGARVAQRGMNGSWL